MAALIFFNGAATTSSAAINGTQFSITGQSTATWSPTGDYFVRIDGTAPGTTTAIFEIVRVTSNTQGTGTFVCTRGQGSTQAQAFAPNSTLTPIMDATAVNAALVRLDSGSTQAMAAPITVPPGGGLSVPTTSFGSYLVKIDDILVGTDSRYLSATPQITFLNTSGSGTNVLPTGFRHLVIEWLARGDTAAGTVNLNARFNNDSGANYASQRVTATNATVTASESNSAVAILAGVMPAATANAGFVGCGRIELFYYATTAFTGKVMMANTFYATGLTTGAHTDVVDGGVWNGPVAVPVTRIDLTPSAGNFIIGSVFTLYGIP